MLIINQMYNLQELCDILILIISLPVGGQVKLHRHARSTMIEGEFEGLLVVVFVLFLNLHPFLDLLFKPGVLVTDTFYPGLVGSMLDRNSIF